MKVVLATHNQGKIREFQKILSEIGWDIISVSELGDIQEPEETGRTFEENALQKARYYANITQFPVLADDSGIIADILQNKPGIYSARYAGQHGDDKANNEKLIKDLSTFHGEDRRGHYVCVIALVWPNGKELTVRGTCEGIIRDFYQGTNGFGYDPLFYIPSLEKTMAELSIEEKNKISHRGHALQLLLNKLKTMVFD